MNKCPVCYGEFSRRKDGRCPGCGTEIIVYDGVWIDATIGNPVLSLLKEFEKRLSDRLSVGRKFPVVWRTPKSKKNEYMARIKRMWEYADKDIGLCRIAFDVASTSSTFNGFPTTIGLLEYNWHTAVAIAKSELQRINEEKRKKDTNFDSIMRREDIFR